MNFCRLSLVVAVLALASCPATPPYIECVDQTSCGLAVGGQCLANPATGHQFCAYPDGTCPGGLRWSDYDVETGISGACVAEGTDAGVDAPTDAAGVNQWARGFGGAGADYLRDLVVTPDNGAVIVGSHEQTITFGGGSLTSMGGEDAFVAKLSATGEHAWSKRYGGMGDDGAYAAAVDAAGNVYVIGRFVGVVDFDGHMLGSGTAFREFAIKLDGATGARIWAVQLGGGLSDKQDLAVSPNGDTVAVVGSYFGTINLGGTTFTSAGGADSVIAKYNGAGQHVWSRSIGGTGTDVALGLALLGQGDVAVVGSFNGPASFGAAQPLASPSGGFFGDTFVARYAGVTGAHVWSFGYGGMTGAEELFSVAADASALYVGGHFGGTVSFGGPALAANGMDDGVIAKYDAATGAHIWSKRFGGSSYETAQRLTLDGSEVWFGGYFSGTTIVGGSSLATAGVSDLVYGRAIGTLGDIGDSWKVGGPGPETLSGFGLTATHVWIGSTYSAGFPIFGENLSPAGMTDIFIGRTAR